VSCTSHLLLLLLLLQVVYLDIVPAAAGPVSGCCCCCCCRSCIYIAAGPKLTQLQRLGGAFISHCVSPSIVAHLLLSVLLLLQVLHFPCCPSPRLKSAAGVL
jgi:hypothetical protein